MIHSQPLSRRKMALVCKSSPETGQESGRNSHRKVVFWPEAYKKRAFDGTRRYGCASPENCA
ncbi:hypothetical protein HanIR_Chr09g0401891 [Helianthus annuus]|nr:hypothetical protein HanIR_Chr09g0401891 [Helianthus annuus]